MMIDPIQRKMENAKFSKKIIERTYLSKEVEGKGRGKTVTFHIKSDYISESGFPVAVMMEKGRKAYDVHAKANRKNPHLKYIDPQTGDAVYKKKVHIPKKEGSKIIKDTINAQKSLFAQKFKFEEREWMRGILKG